jgi:putative CocE/NonD family hydrolase
LGPAVTARERGPVDRVEAAGVGPGERRLNGPQTTGRSYRNLSEPQHRVRTEWDLEIAVRDGTVLLGDVLRPDDPGAFPALLAVSPYPRQIQNTGAPLGFVEAGASDFFVPRGYVHVIVNQRGTSGSGGTYDLNGPQTRQDLYDVVEWVAAQPWCDGRVGMIGISAFAMAQCLAAVAQPPHLEAIFPVATTLDVWEVVYHGGLLNAGFISAWLNGVAVLAEKAPDAFRGRKVDLAEHVLKLGAVHRRFEHLNGEATVRVLQSILRTHYPPHPWDDLFFEVAVEHQTKDDFWRDRDVQALIDRVRVPIYFGCDWGNVPVHLPSTFRGYAAVPDDVPKRLALMGYDGLTWPWESLHVEALAWFDHWLKGRDTGILEGPPIRYVLPGADDGWRTATAWPPPGIERRELALRADGRLDADEGPPGERSYLYLPPTLHRAREANPPELPASLTWETDPLPADLDVVGPIELVLDATLSAIDAAWIATIHDVDGGGSVTEVTAGWLRASLRHVDRRRSRPGDPLLPYDRSERVPAGPERYRIRIVPNARRFAAGHRLRLTLASDDTRDGPAFLGFQHLPIAIPARISVASSSRLSLPVLPADAPAEA